ncbi:MAG: CHRD domain-containing protein [Dongiaceae bacterium]
MRLPRAALLAGLVLLAGCAGGSQGGGQGAAQATGQDSGPPPAGDTVTLGASLTGAGAAPPTDSAGKGTLLATLGAGGVLNWELRLAGLSGPPTGIRLYDGPEPVVDLASPPAEGTVRGAVRIDDARRADLLAGRWAAEVRTAAHPAGEIRGPIAAAQ